MDTLIIEKNNEVYITVDCDPNVQRELSEFFTFYVPVTSSCLHSVIVCGMAR